jgi:hypothetical protein
MAVKRKLPDLSNATPGFLLAAIAEQRQIQKDGKFFEGIYREKLKSMLTADQLKKMEGDARENVVVESDTLIGTFLPGTQERLDTDKIRADMSLEWIKEHTKEIPMTTLKITAKGDGTVEL